MAGGGNDSAGVMARMQESGGCDTPYCDGADLLRLPKHKGVSPVLGPYESRRYRMVAIAGDR